SLIGRVCLCLRLSFPARRSSDLSGETDLPRLLGLFVLDLQVFGGLEAKEAGDKIAGKLLARGVVLHHRVVVRLARKTHLVFGAGDRKSTRLNSSHVKISSAVFCL